MRCQFFSLLKRRSIRLRQRYFARSSGAGVAAVGLGGDHRLDPGVGRLLADRVGIVAFVGEQGIDPVGDHAH